MVRLTFIPVAFLLLFQSVAVFGQTPVSGNETFLGRLDTELTPDLVHIYQRRFEAVASNKLPKFVPALAKGTSVSTGELIARTGKATFVAYLADSNNSDPFVGIDLNGNGTIEASERTMLRRTPQERNEFGAFVKLPINNKFYTSFPVYFGYFRGFTHPRLNAGDTLTFHSVWAHAYGSVRINGRNVRMLYPFEPTEDTISTTEGLFGIDADGDGEIRNEEFSPETSYATRSELVFRLGDLYVSTSTIDLVKNEIIVRRRTKDEYLRFEIEVGKVMPDFSFVDVEGKTRNLYEFKGKYILLDFWGVWCADCLVETPYHIEAYKRFRTRGFEILGLNTDEDIETLKAYQKKSGITWPQARNDSIRKLIEETYRIQEYPSTILIGPDAKVLILNQQELRRSRLIETLERVLPK